MAHFAESPGFQNNSGVFFSLTSSVGNLLNALTYYSNPFFYPMRSADLMQKKTCLILG